MGRRKWTFTSHKILEVTWLSERRIVPDGIKYLLSNHFRFDVHISTCICSMRQWPDFHVTSWLVTCRKQSRHPVACLKTHSLVKMVLLNTNMQESSFSSNILYYTELLKIKYSLFLAQVPCTIPRFQASFFLCPYSNTLKESSCISWSDTLQYVFSTQSSCKSQLHIYISEKNKTAFNRVLVIYLAL